MKTKDEACRELVEALSCPDLDRFLRIAKAVQKERNERAMALTSPVREAIQGSIDVKAE